VSEKVKSEVCIFPEFGRVYSVIEKEKMFKGKELLCVEIVLGE
jgi:hypothetical protein